MASAAPARHTLPPFWLLHAGGWLAYGVAMTVSRVGMFPLRYMIVSKGLLMVLGVVVSLGLRYVYRPLVHRGTSVVALLVVSVVASYVASVAWTAASNALDYPVTTAFGVRGDWGRGPFRPFYGAVYNAFTLLAWSVLYIGIRYYAALQAERERSLRAEAAAHQAQLEALRYQINPHFLFNALNAVSTLVAERRNDEASRMLARVSDFLRLTLTTPVRDEVPLAEEIDYIRRYLDIERVRFDDRLRTEIDIAEDAWEAAVPAFVLQPLIENAVRYAVAPREAGGSIVVEAERSGDVLRVSVVDDGPGVREAASGNGAAKIGLANTRERLRQLYGDRGRFELVEASGGGTRATIEIPYARVRPSGARMPGPEPVVASAPEAVLDAR
ncbi:MAG TPA: histidine kinase [Gemmatimonadaceae bacterium]|nr:histidine kinase [Gemmatimonadaceae bacterium]